ncbi:unnamed protein product [Moneuplotes crassus]|uniref:Uncharacterized protein n=1 Tax=Euplotes crassus TaxID=5936 RepID=A0AAD1UBU9_EUPCR|nr:unnamed protein product [Moneuplotes crassus]
MESKTFVPASDDPIRFYKVFMCRWAGRKIQMCNKETCTHAHSKSELRSPKDPLPLKNKQKIKTLFLSNSTPKTPSSSASKEELNRLRITLKKSQKAAAQKEAHLTQRLSILCEELENKNEIIKNLEKTCEQLKLKNSEFQLETQRDKDLINKIVKQSKNELTQMIEELSKLKKSNDHLRKFLENGKLQLATYIEHCNSLKQTIKDLKDEARYSIDLDSDDYKDLPYASRLDYRQLLSSLLEKIESIYECPLSFEKIKEPAILPSGNTISSVFYKELAKKKFKDPFDKSRKLPRLIVNRFAVNLREILDEVTINKINMEKKWEVKSQGCQANIILNTEDEIEEIHNLRRIMKDIKHFYEGKCFRLTNMIHSKSFKAIVSLFQSPSIPTLLLLLSIWHKYSKHIFTLYLSRSRPSHTVCTQTSEILPDLTSKIAFTRKLQTLFESQILTAEEQGD